MVYQRSITDESMNINELLKSILKELDGYADHKWKAERIEITKGRIRHLLSKTVDRRDELWRGYIKDKYDE